METGLLNFHDEETFTTSIYDQDDFSGVECQSSLLDMMHSDLQYSSDYLNQSAVHWDSDQEQEHNGDHAVLPVAPSECSSLNSSREDYNKSLFEWQDSLLPYQPLDPDGVDLRLDGQVIPSELPDNIFEDSFESSSSVSSNVHKPSPPDPPTPARCSTPNPCTKESAVSSDASLNLDVSLSGLDVNVSDLDVSELGINVSSLEIKAESCEILDSRPLALLDDTGQSDDIITDAPIIKEVAQAAVVKQEVTVDDQEFTALFGPPSGSSHFQTSPEPMLGVDSSELPVSKLQNPDVEQLHDIAMEFIKEEQEAEAWDSLPLVGTPLDCNVDLDSINVEVPVLEAGNLESLLEQFEASLNPTPDFSQSMPASPAHFSVPPSPLSMPASPSCTRISSPSHSHMQVPSVPKSSPRPPNTKTDPTTPKKSPLSKGVSVLHQNILESIPAEIMDRIKASGQKKSIPVIPAMPSKKTNRSSTRMHAAGATLSRNKLLKLVSRKGAGEENIQFDHDYCSNDISDNVEFVPEKLVEDIKASTKLKESEEDKSRKDSGLESGDVSEDSEGATVSSGASSGYDSGSSGSRKNKNSILKPRISTQGGQGRNKEMLMVSVLKKVRCDSLKSPSKPPAGVSILSAQQPSGHLKKSEKPNSSLQGNAKLSTFVHVSTETPSRPVVMSTSKLTGALQQQGGSWTEQGKSKTSCETFGKIAKPAQKPEETLTKSAIHMNSVQSQIQSKNVLVKSENIVKSGSVVVKQEAADYVELSPRPSENSDSGLASDVTILPPEQPKKRKLNLEEYRNRQKALEQKRDAKESVDPLKVERSSSPKSVGATTPSKSAEVSPSSNSIDVTAPSQSNNDNSTKPSSAEKMESSLKPVLSLQEKSGSGSLLEVGQSVIPSIVKEEKHPEPISTLSVSHTPLEGVKIEEKECVTTESVPLVQVKEEVCLETVTDKDASNSESEAKPAEVKKKRQYRSRRMSTSSSEGSPQAKQVSILSIKRENPQRKINLFPAKASSKSPSPPKTRSRSVSSESSRSSSSSSSSSSCSSRSRSGDVKSSRHRRTQRKRRDSYGRSRKRSSSYSSSHSSRRSNSMSSCSSHRSRRRSSSSRSRRRSRSRSVRRSRRERSLSRGSWRHWRRDSSRSRSRSKRKRGRCSSSVRKSINRCWSQSRSRSRSPCRRRTSRSRIRTRTTRRFHSISSRSESRSRSRSSSRARSKSGSWSSRSRSYSSGCYRRYARSRSRSLDVKRPRMDKQRSSERTSWRSRSPMRRNVDWTRFENEHKRQVEERRVIYVGRISEDTSKAELKKRFEMFGPILDISLHFREHADNYGFVTFAYKVDAYDAVERGNNDPTQPRYDLCFGGRRKFCRERYADLDGAVCKNGMGPLSSRTMKRGDEDSFDDMLREVQAKLQARKKQ